jgi:hypothetical protein
MVWITMLALKDQDGFVAVASVGNLAHIARVDMTDAKAAVETLEGVDLESSDDENQGRRIERVPGGWVVLNATKYDGIVTKDVQRERTRERVRKHRAKRKSNAAVTQSDSDSDSNIRKSAPLAVGRFSRETSLDLIGRVKAAYPAGIYRQVSWMMAEREIGMRMDEGITDVELEEAAAAYCRQQMAKGSIGSQFVLSPDKFFAGAIGPWQGPFEIPKLQEVLDPRKQQERAKIETADARQWADAKTKAERIGFRQPGPAESLGGYTTLVNRFEDDLRRRPQAVMA